MRFSSSDLLTAVQLFTQTIIIILHKVPTTQRRLTNIHGRRKTPKYLEKSCYYHIKCIVSTFMATFMQSIPLNSVSWEITTQKKLKKKFDGTNTQVMAQMMNKCKGKIVQGDYIMENIFHKKKAQQSEQGGDWHYLRGIKEPKEKHLLK